MERYCKLAFRPNDGFSFESFDFDFSTHGANWSAKSAKLWLQSHSQEVI